MGGGAFRRGLHREIPLRRVYRDRDRVVSVENNPPGSRTGGRAGEKNLVKYLRNSSACRDFGVRRFSTESVQEALSRENTFQKRFSQTAHRVNFT